MPVLRRWKKRSKLEREKQAAVRDWAYETYGRIDLEKGTGLFLISKLTALGPYGEPGYPDQCFYMRGGTVFFIEWKRTDKEHCTDLQIRRHAELRALGYVVEVHDDEALARAFVTSMVRAGR